MVSRSGRKLQLKALAEIPLIRKGDDLSDIITTSLKDNQIDLQDGDICVIAQKIVSKAEGRQVDLQSIEPSPAADELAVQTGKDPRVVELILQESNEVLRQRQGLIIVEHKLGFVCANAGIDRSNISQEDGSGEGSVLLLPENPDRSAKLIRQHLEKAWKKSIAVLIIDSHGRAWRNGTSGLSIGFSGLPGVVDLRGEPDLFGYSLKVTQIAAADELAAAASLIMGQADEALPVVHVRGFPYDLREGSFQEILRDPAEDLFR